MPTALRQNCDNGNVPAKLATDHGTQIPNPSSSDSRPSITKRKHGDSFHEQALWQARKSLPVWSHSEEICHGLRTKDVMILVGETGSGKSTQVPQMLAREPWCKRTDIKGKSPSNTHVGGCIAVTEPRRVAAISLARRVAREMGTPLGNSSPASRVGYSVRFDNNTSPSMQIKFLTEGMLLQEMLRDPWLRQYNAVIVDEVHERSVNVDLVLGFLKNLVEGSKYERGGVGLKVVVMSATGEMDRLLEFFEGRKPEGSESEWEGFSSDEDNKDNVTRRNGTRDQEEPPPSKVSTCYFEGRQYPVTIKYLPEPIQDFVDAALNTIFQIHCKEPMPGDILVYLTGQEAIESLETLVKEYAQGMRPDVPKLLVLPLFAALPQDAQQRVFNPAPQRTRKIILATNIAETSVTVPGVRFVIDCGKAKIKHFRTSIGLDSLLVKPISRSAAIQRTGRAGREAPGQCLRLYTEKAYLELQESNTPEILRCDLSHAILTMKARGIDDVVNFPFLDPPPREALEKALLHLYQLEALTHSGAISDIGLQMAKYPLNVSLARTLIAATKPEYNCVAEVIDIISCLSVESIFLNLQSEEKKEQAEAARRDLFRREGDHLTFLSTVQGYAAENSDRKAWTLRYFVSHRAMKAVMDVRKQLQNQCKQFKEISADQHESQKQEESSSELTGEMVANILKCFLTGFHLNTARLLPDGSYKTVVGNQIVAIHPSSGLYGKKVEAIMYNEFVFTNRSYARGVSAVQMDWIGEWFDR